jgi:hypothetical protein
MHDRGQAGGDKRDDISAYALRVGERPVCHPASVSSGLGWPQAGVQWCGVFQVVKTAQSRGRTERTLHTALSQLLLRDKGREVWFSLGENHEKACGFPGFLLSAGARAGRRDAADRRNPSLVMSHLHLLHPSHHAGKR